MAKDPAFLFYPGDWNLGTMHLTLLEKGCYIELLILQFAKGKFTEAHAKHMLNGSFDLAWATIREKFSTDGTFYWNKRLMAEKEKRQKFTESRRSNAITKKKPKAYAEHMHEHMPMHMEDENINNNNPIVISINTNTISNTKGEKKQFNTMPIIADFNGLPENYYGQAIEIVKITKQSDIDIYIVKRMWEVFKVQHLTGTDYYPNEGKVYSHFINWIKNQNFNNGTAKQNGIIKSAVGAHQLLDKLKSETFAGRKQSS